MSLSRREYNCCCRRCDYYLKGTLRNQTFTVRKFKFSRCCDWRLWMIPFTCLSFSSLTSSLEPPRTCLTLHSLGVFEIQTVEASTRPGLDISTSDFEHWLLVLGTCILAYARRNPYSYRSEDCTHVFPDDRFNLWSRSSATECIISHCRDHDAAIEVRSVARWLDKTRKWISKL